MLKFPANVCHVISYQFMNHVHNLHVYFLLNSFRYTLAISEVIINDKFVSSPQMKHNLTFYMILENHVLLDLCSPKNQWKHWTSNFVYTKLPPGWKNSMLFTRQLHLLQWYTQATLCMCKTDYIVSVMTVTFYLHLKFLSDNI